MKAFSSNFTVFPEPRETIGNQGNPKSGDPIREKFEKNRKKARGVVVKSERSTHQKSRYFQRDQLMMISVVVEKRAKKSIRYKRNDISRTTNDHYDVARPATGTVIQIVRDKYELLVRS